MLLVLYSSIVESRKSMLCKRTEKEILNLILNVANEFDLVRAVILNGSKANINISKDNYQDFDILFIVRDVEFFVENNIFPAKLGEILIMQKPDEIDGFYPTDKNNFTYLMLFTDENRIDLKLINENSYANSPKDSLSLVLLDKDNKYSNLPAASDSDYIIQKPTEVKFKNTCNEFLWLSTYVAKGLVREQILYSKYCLDSLLRDQLINLLANKAAINTNFSKNFGSYYKYLENYLDAETWNKYLATYSKAKLANIWNSLFLMCTIFYETAVYISTKLDYPFNKEEFDKVLLFLNRMKKHGK